MPGCCGWMVCAALLSAAPSELPEQRPTGCQIGAEVPSFFVREVTSERPTLATCLVCRYGARPVVLVCVRQMDEQTEQLLEAVDRAVDGGRGQGLRGFALFLTDAQQQAQWQPKLMALARQRKVALPLTVPIETGGPRSMELPDQAAITVLCYANRQIVERMEFASGEATAARREALLERVRKLTQ